MYTKGRDFLSILIGEAYHVTVRYWGGLLKRYRALLSCLYVQARATATMGRHSFVGSYLCHLISDVQLFNTQRWTICIFTKAVVDVPMYSLIFCQLVSADDQKESKKGYCHISSGLRCYPLQAVGKLSP